ncbi:TraR/DksA family transcriptional regulator [Salmonella enterica subsp. enterica]|nr:TraR/DksA family transcriptional regulator [Salmonella enterica subsp. enterica serovar Corvallis]EAB6417787.1 TraR/DksA family transcriptional regulator [Salmonella enterica subsp. enterica]EBW4803096.1 TraR/DksA family transcriptional regulator [Salmonella enterica subsp. enterica serovar Corvallis]EBW6508916.1 TraR/DksA family transcriptional regulator [Salmonella enterica subsp. enterica serovar Corvallis]EBX4885299.1 TraR/DksA family transcriptional regulator [Salmonella enterica subsp.
MDASICQHVTAPRLENSRKPDHRLNHSAVSATHCEECGDKLLDARRKAYPGCTMCVSCQGEKELRKKIGRM